VYSLRLVILLHQEKDSCVGECCEEDSDHDSGSLDTHLVEPDFLEQHDVDSPDHHVH
jgi:hypothetical protein